MLFTFRKYLIIVLFLIIIINVIYGEQIIAARNHNHNNHKEGYSSIISKYNGTETTSPLHTQYNPKPTDFNTNNYDVVYHDTPQDIQTQSGIPSVIPKTITVIAPGGKGIIELPFYGNDNVLPIYGEINSYKYGVSSNYVPDYESSIYLGLANIPDNA